MRKLRLATLVVVITLSCYSSAWADTFMVTSALASGAGSLREAIEKANANGTAVTDYILFDLPTRRGPVTILLNPNMPLPGLTSNIIIDASSQPGDPLGVTNAKVAVAIQGFFSNDNTDYYIFQASNATNVQIYGFFLWAQVGDRNTGTPPTNLYAIHLRNCSEVTIGAPGKGNLISGWKRGVYTEYFRGQASHHITVQSNTMGVNTDGISTVLVAGTRPGDPGTPATNQYGIYFDRATDIFIGGEAPGQGNSINAQNDIFCTGHPDPAINDSLLIINNKLGIDINDDMVAANSLTGITVQDYQKLNSTNRASAGLIIRKNYIAGRSRFNAISLANIQSYFAIEQNLLGGEKRNAPIRNTTLESGIMIVNCPAGIIGGTAPGNENYIRYCSRTALMLTSTSNITFRYNSTYCNNQQPITISNWAAANGARPQPFITINGLNQATGTIRGTALPGSTIDLYADDNCPGCEGKTHLGLVTTADASGQWTYTDPALTGKSIIATATDPQGATSKYSAPLIEDANVRITGVSCTALGAICGVRIISGAEWEWRDEAGTVVSRDTCLSNVPAGTYTLWLPVGTGSCESTYTFIVPDNSLNIDSSAGIMITNARCNKNNGSICGINPVGATNWGWEDAAGNFITTAACLRNVLPGSYRFRVTDGACDKYTRYYTITNTSPDIDAANLQTTATTCSQPNASISGITLSGMNFSSLQWINENRNVVGTTADLSNIPAGRYKLIALDNTAGCGDSTNWITITATPALALNTTTAQISDATCGQTNGSIRNITFTNPDGMVATIWVDEQGTVVGNNLDLQPIKAGKYRLKIKDRSTCDTLISPVFEVSGYAPAPLLVIQATEKDATCNQSNGSIQVNQLNNNAALYTFRWLLDSTTQIGSALSISNLNPATYHLIATDANGCGQAIYKKTIRMQPLPAMNEDRALVQPDRCGFGTGSITGIIATSAAGALQYQWFNSNNQIAGQQPTISNLHEGNYHLLITDINGCQLRSAGYAITQDISTLPVPQYDNITIARHTDGILKVKNPQAGATYILYNAATNTALEENQTGIFTVRRVPEDTHYYIEYKAGPCNSDRGQVSIKVIDMTKLDIPNTFTPNNDGINDEFRIRITGYFKLNGLKIFNRWGQLVFETKDPNFVWNGKKNGHNIPVATYYWVIEGIDLNGKFLRQAGSVTLIR
ncbi:MAG: gliding motility-associated C-terminal domain-containing protein [Niastella sp.]|nr:gliding motility-associated C-terminal domain-containing protein [Niastella sp.]